MGGFGNALKELLGGFNAQRRIDKEGFDWREKSTFADAERQRAQEEWAQANEDRGQKQLTSYLLGTDQPDEEVVNEFIGPVNAARRKGRLGAAMGETLQSKSALKAQDAYNRKLQRDAEFEQREKEIGLKGDEAQELLKLRYKEEAGQPMTQYERERIRVLDAAVKARTAGPSSRRRVLKVPGSRDGVAGTVLRDQDTMEELGFEPAAPTAATRQRGETMGAAQNALKVLLGTYETFGGQPKGGFTARATGLKRGVQAAAGYAPEVQAYKKGVRGFVPLLARSLGHVGVLTELDVQRTEELLPGPGDTAAEKALKIQQIDAIMNGTMGLPFRFGQGGGKPFAYVDETGNVTPVAGQPTPGPAAPKTRRRFNPATGRLE